MLTAELISNKLHEDAQSRIKIYPCNNLRASNIGHPCERYLYLLIRHWEEQEPHGERLQHIFDLGNSMEEYTIKMLKQAGLTVIQPKDYSWKVENPLITGREDIRIEDPEDGQFYPAEIKGLSPFEWEKLNTVEDFYNSKHHYVRAYPSQLLVYMWKFEKEKGFFVLTNKLTGEIKIIEVPFDWDRADEMLKKGERIYAALNGDGDIPDCTDDMSVCEECGLKHLCSGCHKSTEMEFDDGELEDLLDQKEALAPAYREYNKISDQIKSCVGERDKVFAGKYLVSVSTINKAEYTVKASVQKRINVKRV